MDVRELWLYNPTSSDVLISDLGVKVPAGKAVNVYRSNPYLTTTKVKESVEHGAVARRVQSKVLKIVNKKPADERPKIIDQIKVSDSPIVARKTKSSVVIERGMTEEDLGEGGEFEFADYGVEGPVEYANDKESVVVRAKVDEEVPAEKGETLEIRKESGLSKQAQIVMDVAEKSSHPMGKVADISSRGDQPFVVSKPPEPTPEPEPVFQVAPKPKIKVTDTKEVVIEGKVGAERSMVDEIDDADKVISMDTIDVMKVATRQNDGAIVMEISDEEQKDEPKKKSKVVTRKKRTKASKK